MTSTAIAPKLRSNAASPAGFLIVTSVMVGMLTIPAAVGRSQVSPMGAPITNSSPAVTVPREVADLDYARQNYDRYRELYHQGAVSRMQLDQAESAYAEALARYQIWLQSKQPNHKPAIQGRPQSQSRKTAETRNLLQAELAKANATVQLTETEYQRYQRLYQEGAVAREQVERSEMAYRSALAQRDMIQKQLTSLR